MGIFYRVCAQFDPKYSMNINKLGERIFNIMPKDEKEELPFLNFEYYVNCRYFRVSIAENNNAVKFRSEDYNMTFTHGLWIDMNNSVDWYEEFVKFAGRLLKITKGDFLLESNGDKPFIIRHKEDEVVIVHKKLKGSEYSNENLDIEYIYGEIEAF